MSEWQLVNDLVGAIAHLQICAQCGEDSLESCPRGGQAALDAHRRGVEWLEEQAAVTIQCEGCSRTYQTPRTKRGYPSSKGTPSGWAGCGKSTKHPGRIAEWCPTCKERRATQGV